MKTTSLGTASTLTNSASKASILTCSVLLLGMLVDGCDSPPAKNADDEGSYPDASPTPGKMQCATAGNVWTKNGCVEPAAIKLNTVGYVPGRKKIATVPDNATGTTFVLRDTESQQQVYSGDVSANTIDVSDTGDTVRTADFSAFDVEGTYVLEVEGLPQSPPFTIGATVYNDIFKSTLLGFYGQRCGSAVTFDYDGDTFSHATCHMNDAQFDATMIPGASGSRVATGGWHDAGDYGKYVVNGAFSVAFLLKAWEDFGQPLAGVRHIPSSAGTLPDILSEAKYELDWLLSMQQGDGSVLQLVCPKNFPGDTVSPEKDTAPRYFLKASTGATAYFVAASAMASRAFRAFDSAYADSLLLAARNGQAWLDANPTNVPTDDGPSSNYVAGGPYNVSAGAGSAPRTWASVELWRANGGVSAASVESALGTVAVAGNWDWAGPSNLAVFDYADSDSTERDATTLANVQSAITSAADILVATAQSHGYGRALGSGSYYWGSAGVVARSAMNLFAAYRVSKDTKYLDAATLQVDYLLGRNPFGRSLVTGLGYAPPIYPHHRPSNADRVNEPWPGLLIGGPNKDSHDPMTQANPDIPVGRAWYDLASDYYVNEIAINWNAALAYVVAGFVK